MTRALAAALLGVVAELAEERHPNSSRSLPVVDYAVERPKSRDHGDWTTSVALKLAKYFEVDPRELATEIAERLTQSAAIMSVEVGGPGFINIRLDSAVSATVAKTMVEAGVAFGSNDQLRGHTISIEFVSANLTGPLHIGHTRWAALGDAVARLLVASGASVVREFYINDAGVQMEHFGRSVLAAAKGEQAPEDGYVGSYIEDLARRVIAARPDLLDLEETDRLTVARDLAYGFQLSKIQASLVAFNVRFDVWFSERVLHARAEGRPSLVDEAVDRLREHGHVFDEKALCGCAPRSSVMIKTG